MLDGPAADPFPMALVPVVEPARPVAVLAPVRLEPTVRLFELAAPVVWLAFPPAVRFEGAWLPR
jgi:hypothetical protein